MYFNDKVVWITGASSGIGAALAVEASKRGARLILSSRSREKLEAVKNECDQPEIHEVLPLDLSQIEELEAMAKEAEGFLGRVDIMIHNGGISQRALALETDIAVDERLMRTNYLGPVAITKAIVPGMIERKAGQIIVVSSLTGKFGTPLRSGYAASKHALHGFFDSLRAELWGKRVVVTIVCPGYVRTDISINAMLGDGTSQGTMDKGQANGMPPEVCAKRILNAAEKGKEEVLIGGFEKVGVYIKRFLPGYFSQIIRTRKVTG